MQSHKHETLWWTEICYHQVYVPYCFLQNLIVSSLFVTSIILPDSRRMEICWSLGKLANTSIHFGYNTVAHLRGKNKLKTKLTKQQICRHEKRGKDRNALNGKKQIDTC